MSNYLPPLTLTPRMLGLVAQISEHVGLLAASRDDVLTPQLRRGNRIRTIQASLAIENNTLSVEQVTALLDGKQVLGLPREIQEVRNAFAAYDAMSTWRPDRQADLLAAHGLLMSGLIEDAGHFRQGGVGIYRGARLLHMAPPASRVAMLIQDLLHWLGQSDWHPLIASCVFQYEFEFIHPFADGNGRMGRLWQTLILSRWRPVLAYLPVETVICAQQDAYYSALAAADQAAEATPFVEFMLQALRQALVEAHESDQVSDQVARLIQQLQPGVALKANELMQRLGLSYRPTFNKNYLKPALAAGLIEMTDPASPRSPRQQYRRVIT
ncbi:MULTISPECIES: Fic family protein [Pseudomonas]|uniref:Fic family protein n=1 Tax=Pseudomonas TaxID=286 RepID=UPI001CE4753C|nr:MULTISPECIES: Fic family protein [Pseudomonas]MCO7597429.1 Fic family protein [Pseudomonas guariconensis]MCU7223161.1 Fic family protein [Pseudomonas brassicacearum]